MTVGRRSGGSGVLDRLDRVDRWVVRRMPGRVAPQPQSPAACAVWGSLDEPARAQLLTGPGGGRLIPTQTSPWSWQSCNASTSASSGG